jgi:ribosomal protein L11 methyltransferase
LWQLSVIVSLEAEEAVANLMTELSGCAASSYTDAESSRTTVTAFLDSARLWSETMRRKLRAELKRIGNCGLSISPGKISFRKIKSRDWAHSWKHHFKPIRIGIALVVRPSWKRLRARKGQSVVVIDPGLSFGTGHHPTTRFCLEQLVAHRGLHEHRSFLDLGTGSGILAIAAAKLGFAPIMALDVDPDAVAIARGNARRNGLAGKIAFQRKDIAKLPMRNSRHYTIICANLIAPLLISQQARILAQLEEGGVLILAGILNAEFKTIKAAYTSQGLRLVASRVEREWCSGAFRL